MKNTLCYIRLTGKRSQSAKILKAFCEDQAVLPILAGAFVKKFDGSMLELTDHLKVSASSAEQTAQSLRDWLESTPFIDHKGKKISTKDFGQFTRQVIVQPCYEE